MRFRHGLVVLFGAVPLFYVLRFSGLSVSTAQFTVLPLVLLGLALLGVQDRIKIPLWVLILAVGGAVLSGRSLMSGGLLGAPVVASVSKLEGDELGTSTRILREEISSVVHAYSGGRVGAYHHALANNESAMKLLGENSLGDAIVRGDSRWITVVNRGPWSKTLQEVSPRSLVSQNLPLRIVADVPAFGLAFRPREDTAEFLGTLFAGKSISNGEPLTPNLYALGVVNLLSAARKESPWTSFAHRGYAWFLAGNEYFREALSGESYQPSAMECAFRAYSSAKALTKLHDNPDLVAAIVNNTAVGLFVHERQSGVRRKKGVSARALFRKAVTVRTVRSRFMLSTVTPDIASANLKSLRLLGTSVGRMKKGKSSKKFGQKRQRKGVKRRAP